MAASSISIPAFPIVLQPSAAVATKKNSAHHFLLLILNHRPNTQIPISSIFSTSVFSAFGSSRTRANQFNLSPSLRSLRFRRNSGSGSFSKEDDEVVLSSWDEKPYEVTPNGKRIYVDELDVVTLIDPPKELIPIDPGSYNPALYLWKKVEDIPEERRHRLLFLLGARQISRVWEIAGTRYGDPKSVKQNASEFLSTESRMNPTESWTCSTEGAPMPLSWMKNFKKVLFHANYGDVYGRILPCMPILQKLTTSRYPCYFRLKHLKEVMSTEQPCDLAYEFGDGLFELTDLPEGFPKPAQHPHPLEDCVVIYIRHVGPGVVVGQAWQEGRELQQVPRKFCGEILMVKDFESTADVP